METQYIVQPSKEKNWHLSLNLSDSKALSNAPSANLLTHLYALLLSHGFKIIITSLKGQNSSSLEGEWGSMSIRAVVSSTYHIILFIDILTYILVLCVFFVIFFTFCRTCNW